MLRERRQVHELPPGVRLQIREHQALHVRCPRCARVRVADFPADAPSRAQDGTQVRALAVDRVEQQQLPLGRVYQLLSDLFGVRLGRGTLLSWIQQAARALEPVEQHIKTALPWAPVRHHAETGVRRGGRLAWAHVTSTSRLTHYALHPQRGRAALEAIGILRHPARLPGGERA